MSKRLDYDRGPQTADPPAGEASTPRPEQS